MRIVISIILTAVLCFGISGCSVTNDVITDRKNAREECILNEQDASLFTYNGTEYRILEETKDTDKLGAWVGYIQKLAVLDRKNAVLETRKLDVSDFKTNLPDQAAYVIQFLNIYKDNTDNSHLIIDVNDGYHKAVPREDAGSAEIIKFEALQNDIDGEITVLTTNCTQIQYGNHLYQISNKEINHNNLDTYLGVIGTAKVFDSKTKQEISKDKLSKTEIQPGELSRQERVSWTYGTVFSISNIEKSDSIAVEINNRYLCADMIR